MAETASGPGGDGRREAGTPGAGAVKASAGGAASSTAIRALIKQLVGAEDGKKPLSDARLAEILGEQGIVVARRTVAKYRELLGIPPVSLRKAL